jgi:shikimate 5-dehydrogenase
MLCWQGVLAFEQWTGIEPPAAVMRAALAPPAPAERPPSAAV